MFIFVRFKGSLLWYLLCPIYWRYPLPSTARVQWIATVYIFYSHHSARPCPRATRTPARPLPQGAWGLRTVWKGGVCKIRKQRYKDLSLHKCLAMFWAVKHPCWKPNNCFKYTSVIMKMILHGGWMNSDRVHILLYSFCTPLPPCQENARSPTPSGCVRTEDCLNMGRLQNKQINKLIKL